jgi:hypothetical protein
LGQSGAERLQEIMAHGFAVRTKNANLDWSSISSSRSVVDKPAAGSVLNSMEVQFKMIGRKIPEISPNT